MKKTILFVLLFIFFISCSNSNEDNSSESKSFDSKAIITALDLRECVCGCGGFFIEIENETYLFFKELLPRNDLDLSPENLPLRVKLDWELTDCNRITITSIEEDF